MWEQMMFRLAHITCRAKLWNTSFCKGVQNVVDLCLGLPDCCNQNTGDFFKPCDVHGSARVPTFKNKKAVLSQRWPRDISRYISRTWAVAEIWPFEIIQDCGGRHLEFVQIENSAIRPAVPENPTLDQNRKWIGRPVAEISPLEIFLTWRWPPSWICSNRK